MKTSLLFRAIAVSACSAIAVGCAHNIGTSRSELTDSEKWNLAKTTYYLAVQSVSQGDTTLAASNYERALDLLGALGTTPRGVQLSELIEFNRKVLESYETFLASKSASKTSAVTATESYEPAHATKYVNADVVNVRSGPSKDYEVVGQLSYLDEVLCTDSIDGDWLSISYNSELRWIYGAFLSDDSFSAMISFRARQVERASESPRPQDSRAGTHGGYVSIGTPADDVIGIKGKCNYTEVLGEDENGYIVAWHYSDVTYVMKRWTQGGIECYRVAEKRY